LCVALTAIIYPATPFYFTLFPFRSPLSAQMPSEEAYDDDFAAEGGNASPRPPPPPPSARLTFPGLPGVSVPSQALKPLTKVLTATGIDRNPHTVIVAHNKQRDDALKARHMEPTDAQKALRSDSVAPLYPEPVAKWDPGYLNEVAYAETSKARQAADRERGRAKLRAEEAAARAKPAKKRADEGAATESFFDRQMAMDRRLMEGRALAKEKFEAAQRPPPTKHKWCEVQDSFLKRWTEFNKKREENLAKLDAETRPPFHAPGKEPLEWNAEVAAAFFESQDKCIERLKAREAASEEAAKKLSEKVALSQFKSTYVFKTPLPDFYTRQSSFAEGRNMTFEERLAKMRG